MRDCKHCGWSFGAHADWCKKHPDNRALSIHNQQPEEPE